MVSHNFKDLLLLLKQTYYVPFIWALTWYSYWVLRDTFVWHQLNTMNVGAVMISASVIASAQPIRTGVHKAFNFVTPQIVKSFHWALIYFASLARKTIQILPATFVTRNQTHHFIQIREPLQQPARLHTPKLAITPQEPELFIQKPEPVTQKSEPKQNDYLREERPSKTNGCPKNLDYFTQKPRPKQTPEECITCKNLITCVCQTTN